MKNTLKVKNLNGGFIGLIPGLAIGGVIALIALGGLGYMEYQKFKYQGSVPGEFDEVGFQLKMDTPAGAVKEIYNRLLESFFAPVPRTDAPVDLKSVVDEMCYSEAVATQKYSECGAAFQKKREATLYAPDADTQIRAFGDEYDACVDMVYAKKCR